MIAIVANVEVEVEVEVEVACVKIWFTDWKMIKKCYYNIYRYINDI